jgi:hypothetical protein
MDDDLAAEEQNKLINEVNMLYFAMNRSESARRSTKHG